MTDAINKACAALRSAASRFREQAEHWRAKTGRDESQVLFLKCSAADDKLAEECEAALRDLRTQASGEERSGQ